MILRRASAWARTRGATTREGAFRHPGTPCSSAVLGAVVLGLWSGSSGRVSAGEPPAPLPSDALETVLVTTTPVMGTGVPLSLFPSNVQTVRADQIDKDHLNTVTDVAERHFSSVVLADTEGNPFQEDLVVRGFTASPVLGTPQGLAVYQNGVRINEAFGDIVLWDLVPLFAIAQLQQIAGTNSVFGLNALGGALTLELKNGFDFPGASAELAGGSFGRYRATAQDGIGDGDRALYVGATAFHEDGWREFSSSDVVQSVLDGALRGDEYTLGAALTLGWGHLNGNGANPAQDSPEAAFAVPDTEIDHVVFLQTRGTRTLGDVESLQGTAYVRDLSSEIDNGAASGFALCADTVCNDGTPLTLFEGTPVPSSVDYHGILPISTTNTLGLGGSLQLTLDGLLAGRGNVANFGASFDQGRSEFRDTTYLGDLVYLNPPGTTTSSNGLALGGSDWNVQLDTVNRYYGLFFTDTLSVTSTLSATAAGRYNRAQVDLYDLYGNSLNADHLYQRFNPSAGVTYQVSPALNLYTSYSESNRIPTAAELSCANPGQPCTFPLGFVSDPNLEQVIARTVEVGARGGEAGLDDLKFDWFADVYGTRNHNDILFVAAGPLIGSGYFKNAGTTERLGGEAALEGTWGLLDFHASWAFVRATFQSSLTVYSPNNPGADVNGNIDVQPGDRLPEVPLNLAKLAVGYSLTHGVHVGLDAIFVSSQYFRGDEANLQQPLPGYAVVNVRASWQATAHLGFFFQGENIFDHRYSSFGLYGDPTGNGAFPNFTNPRFYTPGAPFGFWAGMQLRF